MKFPQETVDENIYAYAQCGKWVLVGGPLYYRLLDYMRAFKRSEMRLPYHRKQTNFLFDTGRSAADLPVHTWTRVMIYDNEDQRIGFVCEDGILPEVGAYKGG